jgi:hypothetical protein
MDEIKFWNFKIGLEVSARYHDWRRATFESYLSYARLATFVGALITLLTALNPLSWAPTLVVPIIAVTSVIVAVVNLIELSFGLAKSALDHTDLYRRFAALQAKVARGQQDWERLLPEWEAEAAEIRRDEPPTFWAVYAKCWNQSIDRHQLERKGYYRPVSLWQRLLGNFKHFSPQDFPAEA